ncbi:hypothetical protein Taro_018214 [Colocasia esculenta]|uniref:Ketoreductase domain-containing protein n=1 Tax=Colocasia esculenta TaxID=4460 RepID=A0A843UTA4_COLES|nr:hypothetical protein [Colocasia esculenta]
MANADAAAQPQLPLQGRVAIVTGASRGIGRAIAAHLASLGASLVINYASSSAQADRLIAELTDSSPSTPRAVAVRADVSDPADVKALFDRAEEAFGGAPAHILVACAGVIDPSFPHLASTTVDSFDEMYRVNTRGAFLCLREAANRLARSGGGRILAVSSSMIGQLKPGFAAYTGSKAAVEGMVRILAKELAGTGITANCVAPGPTATDMFNSGTSEEESSARVVAECPMGRMGQPGDIAAVVGFLATDAGEWINGQVVRVNGGICIIMTSLNPFKVFVKEGIVSARCRASPNDVDQHIMKPIINLLRGKESIALGPQLVELSEASDVVERECLEPGLGALHHGGVKDPTLDGIEGILQHHERLEIV